MKSHIYQCLIIIKLWQSKTTLDFDRKGVAGSSPVGIIKAVVSSV